MGDIITMEQTTASLEPRHPVRVVSERTGLSPHVLRVWERRYQAVAPARSEGSQRLYSDADVERLTLLHRASAGGRNVSQLVPLTNAQLRELISDDDAARTRRVSPASAELPEAQLAVTEAMAAVEALDGDRLNGILKRALLRHGIAVGAEQVIVPLLTLIGERWHAGELPPSHEHLATAIIQHTLTDVVHDSAAGPLTRPRILVATPAGQRHELGAMLVAATAAPLGWNVLYLGQDLPVRDIARAAELGMARVVALSLVYPANDERLAAELKWLTTVLAPQVTLVFGGAAAEGYAEDIPAGKVMVLNSLTGMRELLVREAAAR
ncbi:MAG: cobalamin B12-binding domain-containing protein [Candidatus Aminicenantes bacterium]|nr:MAG: cobalamin B12-binding domain-containing protein [Candidatus Aminicenantes bacterium]